MRLGLVLVWISCAVVIIESAPNPIHVAVVLVAVGLTSTVYSRGGIGSRVFKVACWFGFVFGLIRIALAALTAHGIGQPIFHLPSIQLPRMIGGYELGGSVEALVIVPAAVESIVIFAIVMVFAGFNAMTLADELVAKFPRRLQPVAMTIMIALSFVPSLIGSLDDARVSAHARTGGRKKLRRHPSLLFMPLLETSLERSVLLAESIESRGFGLTARSENLGSSQYQIKSNRRWTFGERFVLVVVLFGAAAAVVGRIAGSESMVWDGRSGGVPGISTIAIAANLALAAPLFVNVKQQILVGENSWQSSSIETAIVQSEFLSSHESVSGAESDIGRVHV